MSTPKKPKTAQPGGRRGTNRKELTNDEHKVMMKKYK
jgi:hypothetical protein